MEGPVPNLTKEGLRASDHISKTSQDQKAKRLVHSFQLTQLKSFCFHSWHSALLSLGNRSDLAIPLFQTLYSFIHSTNIYRMPTSYQALFQWFFFTEKFAKSRAIVLQLTILNCFPCSLKHLFVCLFISTCQAWSCHSAFALTVSSFSCL